MSQLLPLEFSIQDEFPPVSYDQWRALVESSLGGASFERKLVKHSYEGIAIQPIYSRRDQFAGCDPLGFPGLPPFVRGARPLGAQLTGWDLRQEFYDPDLSLTNQAILTDLEGGATSLWLRLDETARSGLDPDQGTAAELTRMDGIMAYCVDDLDVTLAGVHLDMVGVTLDAGPAFLPSAAILASLWRRRNIAADQVRGGFNADPLAVLARDGSLPYSSATGLSLLAELAKWTVGNYPNVTAVGVDTSPYHNAGATAAQDVAFGMATAVEYLRAMTRAGLDVDSAARQIEFRMCIGTHHFLAIAKLRAARWLWARVIQVCGGSDQAAAMRIHARAGNRVLTRRAPHVNMLRNTVAVFAAGLGGADAITSVPFDSMSGPPSEFSRRVARNTALVLQEEAHLHRVVDPCGGSWFLDQLTSQLADSAWELFQGVEGEGGMQAALYSGWVANRIEAAYAQRAQDIARRKEGITGVSEFPDSGEESNAGRALDSAAVRRAASTRVAQARDARTGAQHIALNRFSAPSERMAAAVEAATDGSTVGQIADAIGFYSEPAAPIPPFELRCFAAPYEELRDASDAWQAEHGRRPGVFLANLGSAADYTARASFAKNFFEVGGFEVFGDEGYDDPTVAAAAFVESPAKIAVICSSDMLYPKVVPPLANRLQEAGAQAVVLAGHPGDNEAAWRAAGVDRFIFLNCDALATLRDMLREVGVLAGTHQAGEGKTA